LARAFEAFTQLHEDQIRDGTGLGLAVSKRFITLHGGRMWIESQEGQGTSVGFALPMADTQVAEPRFSMMQHVGDDQPSVLVLHDDPRALALLRRYIEGYQFVLARTPQRAQEALQRKPPIAVPADAAWLDRQSQTLDELHLPETMPVLTAPLPGMRRSGLLVGVVDYLSKPVTREALAQALERLPEPLTKVVIVDDDPHVVRLLGRMLKAENPDVQVFEAFDGLTGLQVAREQQPSAMMLDLLMPEVSGYDVLETLSKDEALSQLPVIIVSARGVDDEAAPLGGDVRVSRADGFTTTEMLRLVSASLSGVTGLAH
jgi:CheY-like chemotaxis protein